MANKERRQVGLKPQKMYKHFHWRAPLVVLSIFVQPNHFSASKFSSQGGAALVRSLSMNSGGKKMAYDVMLNSATDAGLVHDVTNIDYQTQNGSGHGRLSATFKRR